MLRFAALLVLAFAAAALPADLSPEAGSFLAQRYSPKDYSANPQNWAAVQDRRGFIYVANTDGVLEFDGVAWRRIPLKVRSGVRTLAVDSDGTIYVGGQGEFGYLAPDVRGNLDYVSLLEKVPPTDRAFSDVLDVLPVSQGVYFASHRRLFLLQKSGQLKVFSPTERFGRAFTYKDQFYITATDRGLLTSRNGVLQPAAKGDPKVVRTYPLFANGAAPLLASVHNLFHFRPGVIEPWPTAADKYFAEHDIYALRQLPSGEVAVGTKNGGLVLLSPAGGVERILHTQNGLPSDWVTGLFSDREHGLWITTDNGLARLVTSLTSFGEPQHLRGNVYAVNRLGGALYAGSSLGLFKLRTQAGTEPVFDAVKEVQDTVFVIVEHNGLSLVGGQRGVYLFSGGKVEQILKTYLVYDIGFSPRDPNIIYTAGSEGIQVLKRQADKWTVIAKETGKGQEFRTVLEAADGRVWGTTGDAIWRIDFNVRPAAAEEFKASLGVPPGWINAYPFRGHIVFASEHGLLRFSEAKRRFEPDPELGAAFSGGSKGVSLLREDELKNVWITGKGFHGILRDERWYLQPFQQSGIDELFCLYLDPDGSAWASGANGLLFRRQHRPFPAGGSFNAAIRNVLLTNSENQQLYGGNGEVRQKPRLLYRDNALRFEFAAPFFEDEAGVQYQVRLEGTESRLSDWKGESRKDYTNLPERNYVFHVRARNPHGEISPDATFRFTMLPPWYRTWWAFAVYVSVFLFAGWLILRWRLRALQARNKWLEKVVEQRTAEVRSERDQNEALLLNILPKPVASELRTTGSVKPTNFDEVTVCFSDFVGFTLSSEKLPAQELISSLNDYFTAFDEIIGRYGLEKLKTIGDAYMFAGGLPNTSPSHAVDSVLAALEMVAAVRKLGRPEKGINWSIRLGLYSGPVVAGVVGVRKFAFDIWGNTVNFAARMESAGSANRVNLSETTSSRVFDFIECEPRGPIRIKEGREMEMFFALRPKSELMSGPLVDGIPEAFREKYQQAFSKPPKSFPPLNGRHD